MSNKPIWIVIALIAVAGVAGGVYYFSSRNVTPADHAVPEVAGTEASAPVPPDVQVVGDKAEVAIKGFAYVPARITVKKGTTIVWTNMDQVVHDVVGTDGKLPGLKSAFLKQNETYSFTFDEAGSFAYYCSIHPSMKGTVIVE